MLRLVDKMRGHPFYTKAAHAAIQCYLRLHDIPKAKDAVATEEDYAAMTPADRKKAKAQARRAAAKKNKEKFKSAAAAAEVVEKDDKEKKKNKKGGGAKVKVDEDPVGEKLAAKDPLEEGTRIVTSLKKFAADDIWTHLLAFDLAFRRRQLLLALQGLKGALKIDPSHPELVHRMVKFFHAQAAPPAADAKPQHAKVLEVIALVQKEMLGDKKVQDYAQGLLTDAASSSLLHRISAARALFLIDPAKKSAVVKHVISLDLKHVSLANCVKVHKLLLDTFKDEASAEAYKVSCKPLFPISTYFGSGAQLAKKETAADAQDADAQ
jgi:peptide alpha-N-acetyltransferase